MNLIESCNRVLGISRQSALTIDKYEGLTVLCGTSGGGKNTLLAGIALHTPKEDNHVICTESYTIDCGVLGKVAEMYSGMFDFQLDKVVKIICESSAKNIFIEQYHNHGDFSQPVEDMKKLARIAKDLDKNITICVHRRKEK
tara:strand:- start:1143 stop:1568 length:426 start_codon:yes stop_codon:yes gene_type:complete